MFTRIETEVRESKKYDNNNDNNDTFFLQGYSISYTILAAINRSPVLKAGKKVIS